MKPKAQIAALPVRIALDDPLEVLLVTTRSTKRWTVPKGWPMKGRKAHEAAAVEAWEEAGVRGKARKRPIGRYLYWKRLAAHFELCRVKLYVLIVEDAQGDWPERGERSRNWFAVNDAADLVDEPGLKKVLRELDPGLLRRALRS